MRPDNEPQKSFDFPHTREEVDANILQLGKIRSQFFRALAHPKQREADGLWVTDGYEALGLTPESLHELQEHVITQITRLGFLQLPKHYEMLYREYLEEAYQQMKALSAINSREFIDASHVLCFPEEKPSAENMARERARFESVITALNDLNEPRCGTSLSAEEIMRHLDQNSIVRRLQTELSDFHPHVAMRITDAISWFVTEGATFLISKHVTFPAALIPSLAAHEIDVHIRTHIAGTQSSVPLYRMGLAEYDMLQEGLAVMSEIMQAPHLQIRLQTVFARAAAAAKCVEIVDTGTRDYFTLFHELKSYVESSCLIDPEYSKGIVVSILRGGGYPQFYLYGEGIFELIRYWQTQSDLVDAFVWGKLSLKALHDPKMMAQVRSDFPVGHHEQFPVPAWAKQSYEAARQQSHYLRIIAQFAEN